MNPYETSKLVEEYLLFHYGSAEEILPYQDGPVAALGFAERSVTEMTDVDKPRGRALDVGCAVGRSSFELSRFCESVIGIDFSQAFIDAAGRIGAGEVVDYRRLEEGKLSTQLQAKIPAWARPGRIAFEVGDAMALRDGLGSFDLLHAANLLCRLPQPKRFLARLSELVKLGGELVLTTPCTWLGEFTPPENWPEGATIDWLEAELQGAFQLEQTKDLPMLIRETARKFQWTVAQGSRWRRV